MLPARRRVVPGLAAAVLLLGGCGSLDEAASAQGIAGGGLAAELAAQLGGSATLTYTAVYQLAGGGTATVAQAQKPARSAYAYPGGRVLTTEQAVTECRGARPTCTVTAPPRAGAGPPPSVFAHAQRAGMVAPATVLSLLNAAALDPAVVLAPRDTTIAGHHATCLDLSGLSDDRARGFTACVTNDGVLGSFTGTIEGRTFDVAMTQFESRVRGGAFDVPAGAELVDRRAR